MFQRILNFFFGLFKSRSSDKPVRLPPTVTFMPPSVPPPAPPHPSSIKSYGFQEVAILPELNLIEYVETVLAFALKVEKQTGIWHIIPLAQSAHESRSGNSELARKGLNLFGMTVSEAWAAEGKPVINLPTREIINGKEVKLARNFKVYRSWWESFQDWARLISTVKIYNRAYLLMQKQETAEEGVKIMGRIYATELSYEKLVIPIMREIAKL